MGRMSVQEERESIERRILELPKGYLSVKTIKGKERYYHQWYESGKVCSKYLRPDEYENLKALIDERKSLQRRLSEMSESVDPPQYRVEVVTGEGICQMAANADGVGRRECYAVLSRYLQSNDARVCVLYGLRRTGKTMLMYQAMADLGQEGRSQAVYIPVGPETDMVDIRWDIGRLLRAGFRYFFLDEITRAKGFLQGSYFFTEVLAARGAKVVLTGTDSLGFWLASRRDFFAKALMIHTTRIPYREHVRLMGGGLDDYIRYGGVFRGGEMDIESLFVTESTAFDSEREVADYVGLSVSDNIEGTLSRLDHGSRFGPLQEVHDKGLFRGAVNRVVEDENHRFLLGVLNDEFRSMDLENLLHNLNQDPSEEEEVDMTGFDLRAVTTRLMEILHIRNSVDRRPMLDEEGIGLMREYLEAVDVFKPMPVSAIGGGGSRDCNSICVQPGLRYFHADALIVSLESDEAFDDLTDGQSGRVLREVRRLVSGHILEETVLYDTMTALGRRYGVSKLFTDRGEVDMLVRDLDRGQCVLVEVKLASKRKRNQAGHLRSPEVEHAVESRFGPVVGRYVLYTGPDFDGGGKVVYRNVESYLKGLPQTAIDLFGDGSADSVRTG